MEVNEIRKDIEKILDNNKAQNITSINFKISPTSLII